MSDTECPYCGADVEINHDDGYGYNEDECYQQECGECEKTFTFRTATHHTYTTGKADCLNGGEHCYKQTTTAPREYTRMRCEDCDHERPLTPEEKKDLLA